MPNYSKNPQNLPPPRLASDRLEREVQLVSDLIDEIAALKAMNKKIKRLNWFLFVILILLAITILFSSGATLS